MSAAIDVVHITPHLGGGVGKALSTLVDAQRDTNFRHGFILLEQPEKPQFLNRLKDLGVRVEICPHITTATEMLADADIVQLEWWNHPATFAFLCQNHLPAMRLVVWCHVSGLHTPIIPKGLLEAAHRFVFTSSCSMQAPNVVDADASTRERFAVVSSGTGLALQPQRPPVQGRTLHAGYIGSLNFSKIHPHVVDYLTAVDLPDFKVTAWGDPQNQEMLLGQCRKAGKPNLLEFAGYTTNVAQALQSIDILVYLLNPYHYGTAENILLEAMSAGVVPIVLNNPAEMGIVENGRTGYVVSSREEFADAIKQIWTGQYTLTAMSRNAAQAIETNYGPKRTSKQMAKVYQDALETPQRPVHFADFLGKEPADWLLSFQLSSHLFEQGMTGCYNGPQYQLSESRKGGLLHFCEKFPHDQRLSTWRSTISKPPEASVPTA